MRRVPRNRDALEHVDRDEQQRAYYTDSTTSAEKISG